MKCVKVSAKSQSGGVECSLCPPGFFAGELGQTECNPCPEDRYARSEGQEECNFCNHTVINNGATCGKGLFKHIVAITVSVKITVKHCVNGDQDFNDQNGLHTHILCVKICVRKTHGAAHKTVTLTVHENEA